jgi:Spy/CpxP family protein refolding chaperone
MRLKLVLTGFMLFMIFGLQAQPDKLPLDGKVLKEIRSQRVAFISTRLDLTPEEAQAFWPVYNDYSAKKEQAMKQRLHDVFNEGGKDPMRVSEEEASNLIDEMINEQTRMASLEKEFVGQLRKIISAKKIIKLYSAEHDFKREILNTMRNRPKVRGDRGPGR